MNNDLKGIIVSNAILGGLSDSEFMGLSDSLAEMVGFDIHSIAGIWRVNQKLTKISSGSGGNAVDALAKCRVNSSDGNTYFFSYTSGKVWKVDASFNVTLVYTVVPTSGGAGILGAKEFGGYIWFATENWLHRIPVSATGDWSTGTQANWQDLNYTGEEYGGITNSYTLATSINEGATHRNTLETNVKYIKGFEIKVLAKGTGNWTITLHDSSNNVLGTVTIVNGSLPASEGWKRFDFSSPIEIKSSSSYHFHITSTVADGTVRAITASDLETLNYRIYTTSDSEFHPFEVQNLVLYIGDRNYVHQVEGEVFSPQALNIENEYRIKTLGKIDTDLLIGTYINNNVNKTQILRWNTWSPSYSMSDEIDEVGINAFIEMDNYVMVSAGVNGNLYIYDGARLELVRQIRGEFVDNKRATINPDSVCSFKGLAMFGVSNIDGNPCHNIIYSFGSRNPSYPKVLNGEYPLSPRDGNSDFIMSGLEIGGVIAQGNVLLVAWKNNNDGTFGIDKLDYANKLDKAYFSTRVLSKAQVARYQLNKYENFIVNYRYLPENTNIEIWYKKNHATQYTKFDGQKNDPKRLHVYKTLQIEAAPLQVRVVARTSANLAPEIEDLTIFYS